MQEGSRTVKIKQEDITTVKIKQEDITTVKIKQEGSDAVKIKQEKPDDYEVVTTGQTQAPVGSAQGNHGNIVFSFRTSDNDSVTVVKSELNQDEETAVNNLGDKAKTDKYGEEITVNRFSEETATVNLGEETTTVNCLLRVKSSDFSVNLLHDAIKWRHANGQQKNLKILPEKTEDFTFGRHRHNMNNSGEGTPTNKLGEGIPTDKLGEGIPTDKLGEGTPINKLGEGTPTDKLGEGIPTDKLGEGIPTDKLGEGIPTDKLGEEMEIDKFIEEKVVDKNYGKETATKEAVGLPEGTTGAGGDSPNSATMQLQGLDDKGNKVVILRFPKRKVEETWSIGKVATTESQIKKSKIQIRYPTQTDELKHMASILQHMVKSLEAKTCPLPPVTMTAQYVENMESKSSKDAGMVSKASGLEIVNNKTDKCPETLTSSKFKSKSNFFKCLFCGRKFAQIVHFNHHINSHMGRKPIICGKCDADFYFQSSFVEHFQKLHGVAYLCSECKIQFQEDELPSHLLQHKTSHKFLCGICGNRFSDDQALFNHVKDVKQHESRMPVKCGLCLKEHLMFAELEFHLKEHFGEGQYICQMCDKKFKTAVEFSEHSQLHSELLPFECDACNFRLKNRCDVNHHRKHCPAKVIDVTSTIIENTVQQK